jgi:hypothetical protein
MVLKPKNWEKFQHYRDRCPPWIKLHRHLLNDRAYMNLPLASKAIAPLLWLLASESKDGSFDAASEELAFRLRIASKDIEQGLKPLIDNGFFVDASNMLAPCYQLAIPETERETETERDKKKKIINERPENVSENTWDDFIALRKVKKAPVTVTVLEGITKEATKLNWSLERAMQEMCVQGWQGFKAKWVKESEPEQKDWWVNDRRLK